MTTSKFIPRLVSAIDWAGKIAGLTLVIGYAIFQSGAAPVINNLVEARFAQTQKNREIALNTQFRMEWPTGKWNNGLGLPVDGQQNQSIINLYEAIQKTHKRVFAHCLEEIGEGNAKTEDCEELGISIQIYVTDGS